MLNLCSRICLLALGWVGVMGSLVMLAALLGEFGLIVNCLFR